MPEQPARAVAGIVLAGGRSRRMGRDKSSLVLEGETLLQRTVRILASAVDEVVVVHAPAAEPGHLECPVPLRLVSDPVEGEGPLVGIAAGLAVVTAPVAVVVGVDMPFLQAALVRLLAAQVSEEARWVLPIADHRPQPLCSAFVRSALPVLLAHIAAGDRAPMAAAADLGMVRLAEAAWRAADPEGLSFIDVDTPEELAAVRARIEGAGR